MHRSTLIFIFILSMLAFLLGYNYFVQLFASLQNPSPVEQQAVADSQQVTQEEPAITTEQAQQAVVRLIALPLTINENLETSTQSAALDWIQQHQPSVVTIFGQQISTTAAQLAIRQIQAQLPPDQPALIAVDHEGGQVQRLSGVGFTHLPAWGDLCQVSSNYRRELLTTSAQELKAVGIDVVLGPVVDVASQSAVLATRVCGADPEAVVAKASEVIDIYRQQQLLPVIKHYPGIGSVSRDLHHNFDQVELSPADILVFKELLGKYSQIGVVTAHAGVLSYYQDQPCSLSSACISDLRDFFPDTLVFSDALDMDSVGYQGEGEEPLSLAQRARSAIMAGNDVLLFGPEVALSELDLVLTELTASFHNDSEFRQQVETSLERLKQYQQWPQP